MVNIDEHTGEQIIAQSSIQAKTEEELVKLSFDNFARNQVWPQFTNIARSYSSVIEWLYYSLDYYFFWQHATRLYYQKLILSNKDFFIEVLKIAKDKYLPIRKAEVEKRKQTWVKYYSRSIPHSQGFSDNSVILNSNLTIDTSLGGVWETNSKYIYTPAYISYDSTNEQTFVTKYLEISPLIQFRYKNWTSSESFFALPYTDEQGELQSFYPDFIVYYTNWTIGIFDPKSGFTLADGNLKAKWLEEYITIQNKKWLHLVGGLIEVRDDHFLINTIWDYDLHDRKGFTVFGDEWILK